MMRKKEQAGGFIGAVAVNQHAKAALRVYALAVKSVVSQIAAAKLVPTSQGMLNLELYSGFRESVYMVYAYLFPLDSKHPLPPSISPHSENKEEGKSNRKLRSSSFGDIINYAKLDSSLKSSFCCSLDWFRTF